MASYTKLRDESWGIRIEGNTPIEPGSKILVTKKSGETKLEIVNKVVWSGNGVTLCSIVPTGPPVATPAKKSSKYEACAECGRGAGVVECQDSSGLTGMCCRRCAAGPPWERSFA